MLIYMPKITYYIDTFNYFYRLKPDIIKGSVLDYGSNYGMFLDSSKGKFLQQNYTGLDVDKKALQIGKIQFPSAQFIWYNGHNVVYNPYGTDSDCKLSDTYDTIISYSVLTHTSQEDFTFKIDWLYNYLKPGGSLLISWLDVDDSFVTNYFYKKRFDDFGSCDIITADDYIYLVDNRCSKLMPKQCDFFLSFYNKQYLKTLLKKFNPVFASAFKDIPTCFQSCIIIERT